MTLRLAFLTFIVASFIPHIGLAQKIDHVTKLEVEYWRGFHGHIKVEVFLTFEESPVLALNATVTTGRKEGEGQKRIAKIVTEKDLQPVLHFFNSGKVRQFFADTAPVLQPDGSALSITLTQNSFSLCFSSQHAFSRSPEHAKELGRVALEVFKLAGITIPKNELY